MTMGSYLHINSHLVDEEKVTTYLSMLQSSSPSYPIMASLDIARFTMARIKKKVTVKLLSSYENLRNNYVLFLKSPF